MPPPTHPGPAARNPRRARPAHAEEESLRERIADHEDRLYAHRRDKASLRLEEDLQRAIQLFREAEGAPGGERIRQRLIRQVGSLTKVRDDAVRAAALHVLGLPGHADGAKYVKPFLKPYPDERDQELGLAAVEAAGEIAEDTLVLPLLRVVDKSKNFRVAAQAVLALGHYRHSKRYRARILDELATTLKSDRPAELAVGRDAQDATGPGRHVPVRMTRWDALSRVLPRALNELTGQSLGHVDDWLALVDEYRRLLGALFVADESP